MNSQPLRGLHVAARASLRQQHIALLREKVEAGDIGAEVQLNELYDEDRAYTDHLLVRAINGDLDAQLELNNTFSDAEQAHRAQMLGLRTNIIMEDIPF